MRITLFGEPGIVGDDVSSDQIPRKKTFSVLAALASAGDRGIRRERLASLIWHNRQEAQAKSSLRQALSSLRKTFAESPDIGIDSIAETVKIVCPDQCIDIREFDNGVERVFRGTDVSLDELRRLADLYRGEYLQGFIFENNSFEEVMIAHRHYLHGKALRFVEHLSEQPGAHDATEALASLLLGIDPIAEEAHRALIRIALAENKTNKALKLLDICKTNLNQQLGVEPEPETLGLLEAHNIEVEIEPPTQTEQKRANTNKALAELNTYRRPSLVVLPFEELQPPADDFFSDGVVEEITSALARMRDFRVISRQSAFIYKNNITDPRIIGTELDVRYIINGSVQRLDRQVRINVQLIEALSGIIVWTHRFINDITDLFHVQQTIAENIAGEILPSVRNNEIARSQAKATENHDARDLVLSAYPKLWAQQPEANQEAISLLDKALQMEPDYALAAALKGWCHAQHVCYLWSDNVEYDLENATKQADQASKIVQDDATAFAAIGATYSMTSLDLEKAAYFIDRSLQIDPCNAWGWMRSGWLHVIAQEPKEALACLDRSETLSPLDPFLFNVYFGKALAWASMGELARAIDYTNKGLNAGKNVPWAYRMLASFYSQSGEAAKMEKAVEHLMNHYPNITVSLIRSSLPPAMAERHDKYVDHLHKAGIPR